MSRDRPNVIYILGDDHRADYLNSVGHPVVRTPHLDRLAADGVLFANAFCTSPACTPSRTCHYLGQWERRHGVNFNSGSALSPSAWEMSFPMRMKEEGYYLGWVGKNHVPAGIGGYGSRYFEQVFDYWYGNHGHTGFYPKENPHGGEIYRNATADTQIEVFEEATLDFLEPRNGFAEGCPVQLPRRPQDRPFCLCLTFNLPHGASTGTMQLRPSDDELYRGAYRDRQHEMPLPETYLPFHLEVEQPKIPRVVYNGKRISQYDYVKTPTFLRERQVRTCQTITGMDRMIGNLRQELERLGLADNTLIFFSSDHGLHHGEHGLGGKCFLYEEDIRIPMIVFDPRSPQTARGQVRNELVVVPDLAPTVLELCGIEIPSTMHGSSMVPLLRGVEPEWRRDFFAENLFDGQNYPRSECVRTEEWKYVRYFRRTDNLDDRLEDTYGTKEEYLECLDSTLDGERPVHEELYHLRNDPYEKHNLAEDPACRSRLDAMRRRIGELGVAARGERSLPMTVPI